MIATLAVTVLFTPFHKIIQSAIDRRFYRRKYDAEKVLAAVIVIAATEGRAGPGSFFRRYLQWRAGIGW